MRYLSLFSGALGMDLGLEAAGWECLAVNEIDRAACETIRRNRPRARLFDQDVRALTAPALRKEVGLVEAVVGGPPCQAFSTAGRRRSVEDPRGSLLETYVSLAVSLEPRLIVLENVRGLLSAPLRHRPHAERGEGHAALTDEEQPGGALRRVMAMLAERGYQTTFSLYDAAYFGAPQRRERVVLVAAQSPRRHLTPLYDDASVKTFRQATEGLDRHTFLPLRPHQAKFLGLVPPGGNWRSLPKEVQPEALQGAFHASGGRVGFFRRLAWDKPSPALTTNPTMPATLLAHPEELRPLSLEEYLRLQGFPDDWRVAGSLTDQYRQIGNAVPVALARAVGDQLILRAPQAPKTSITAKTSRYRRTTEVDLTFR